MQKLNTALLLIAIALLVGLWVRPQPGRYRQLGEDYRPYLLDTATGELVVLKAEKAKAQYRQEKEREEAEQKAARDKWLAENCPDILAGAWTRKFPKREFPNSLLSPEEDVRQECEEWQRARSSTGKQ